MHNHKKKTKKKKKTNNNRKIEGNSNEGARKEINNRYRAVACRGPLHRVCDSRRIAVDGAAEFFDHLSDLLVRPRSKKDLGNPGMDAQE